MSYNLIWCDGFDPDGQPYGQLRDLGEVDLSEIVESVQSAYTLAIRQGWGAGAVWVTDQQGQPITAL